MPTTTTPSTTTIVELLSHLVRMPTITSDQATNRAALDWLEEQLHGLPLHIQRLEHGDHAMLLASTRRTKSPKLMLLTHMDVVPAPPKAFKPVQKDGKLFGRGTYDMKFAIATFISILRELGPELGKYDLALLVTTDEETSGYQGAKWLADELEWRPGAILAPDGGNAWELEMGAKGIVWAEVTSTGYSTHSSRPWEGTNAIEQLLRFVDIVKQHSVPEPCGDPEHKHNTLNFGTITGGTVANQVPDSATARLDFRLAPGTMVEDVQQWLNEAKLSVPGTKTTILIADQPYVVSEDGPVDLFRQMTKQVTGHDLKTTLALGSTDARHFGVHHVPVITTRPHGGGHHGPTEWVDIADLGRFYEVTRRFIDAWAKI
jgi:succinyl-diaminopimelate desuccinylase